MEHVDRHTGYWASLILDFLQVGTKVYICVGFLDYRFPSCSVCCPQVTLFVLKQSAALSIV